MVHVDDIGSAVVAGLSAPTGIYNAGAEPIRRADLVLAYGRAVGSGGAGFMPRLLQRLGGDRFEPLTRSQRVRSDALVAAAAWHPAHPRFATDWLQDVTYA